MAEKSRTQKIAEKIKQWEKLYNEIQNLQEQEFQEVELPQMHANIGTCYKYRNCYSAPQSEKEYWWEYHKIIGVRDRAYRTLAFQIDSYGRLEIREACVSELSEKFVPISRDEFLKAVQPMLDSLCKEVNHVSK